MFVVQDYFNTRPLPFIIGTVLFNESRDVGLQGYDVADVAEDVHMDPTEQLAEMSIHTMTTDVDFGNSIQNETMRRDIPPPPPPRPSILLPPSSDDVEVESTSAKPMDLHSMLRAQIETRGTGTKETNPADKVNNVNFESISNHKSLSDNDAGHDDENDEDILFSNNDDPYSLFSTNVSKPPLKQVIVQFSVGNFISVVNLVFVM